jgi:hypothetical protein
VRGPGTGVRRPAQLRPCAPAGSSPAAAPAGPLFVVLESSQGAGHLPDTIAIAGLDGYAKAKTHFKPSGFPWVAPDLGALLPQLAHVAAGRAYYVDGDGVVRSLGVDGGVREETRFPVTSGQQEVSFAVSPNGRQLVGAVVTLPPEPNPPPTPPYVPSTPYAMEVFTANAGSSASVAYHRTWMYQDNLGSGAQFVGWDTGGPVATWPSALGTQGGGPHQWNGNALVHYPGGRPGNTVPAPGGCYPWDLLPTGFVVCGHGDNTFQVLGTDGRAAWNYAGSGSGLSIIYGFLSPDAQRVVATGQTNPTVFPRSGSPVTLADGFFHSGWIDSQTIAGNVEPSGNFAYVTLADPSHAVDLGFKGTFVGGMST